MRVMSVETVTAARIRVAVPADLEACVDLDHATETDYVWQMEYLDQDGSLSVTFREARLPRTMRVRYPRSRAVLEENWQLHAGFLVAEIGHKVVGYVNMEERRIYDTGWIVDLVVDNSSRSQGIGTGLLKRARSMARERGLKRIVVETSTKNFPAISFLQRRGLVLCGYNDLYYPNHDIAVFFGQNLR